jgi:hypothetical protein
MAVVKTATVFWLVVFVVISSCSHHALAMQSQFPKEKEAIMRHCEGYMRKHFPIPFLDHNHTCCIVVRGTHDLLAVCKEFTAQELEKISLPRWAKVTYACGNKLPEGSDCAGLFSLIISVQK